MATPDFTVLDTITQECLRKAFEPLRKGDVESLAEYRRRMADQWDQAIERNKARDIEFKGGSNPYRDTTPNRDFLKERAAQLGAKFQETGSESDLNAASRSAVARAFERMKPDESGESEDERDHRTANDDSTYNSRHSAEADLPHFKQHMWGHEDPDGPGMHVEAKGSRLTFQRQGGYHGAEGTAHLEKISPNAYKLRHSDGNGEDPEMFWSEPGTQYSKEDVTNEMKGLRKYDEDPDAYWKGE